MNKDVYEYKISITFMTIDKSIRLAQRRKQTEVVGYLSTFI
jgi:hypothetical protein